MKKQQNWSLTDEKHLLTEKKRVSELKIQAEACTYIWNHYPQTRYLLYHVANEAQRSPVEWGMLKAAGFINGIPDLEFKWNGVSDGIEYKTPDGIVSPAQKIVHAAWASHGFYVYIFRDSQTLIRYVEEKITGLFDRERWTSYESPYSKPEMLQAYISAAKK